MGIHHGNKLWRLLRALSWFVSIACPLTSCGADCDEHTEAGYRVCCGRETEIPDVSCVDLSKPNGEFGMYGGCLEDGQTFDAKFVGAVCCEGLVRTELFIEMSGAPFGPPPGGCAFAAAPSTKVCLPCGNGVCDAKENRCNCPQDCAER
jgi:hypothetical protein